MPFRFSRGAILVLALLLTTVSAQAQGWTKPATTQNTDVTCTTCPYGTGKLTAGYGAPIKTFVGRYLDSQNTRDYQQTFRTGRASEVKIVPERNRIYMRVGSAVFAYDMRTFYTRLSSGETMMASTSLVSRNARTGEPEAFLKPDEWFYAENGGGWTTPVIDGQERLKSFDYDDRGYIYLAYSVFGWGLVKDGGTNSGNRMASTVQQMTSADGVIAVKGANGRYYAVISSDGTSTSIVYDVTTPGSPTKLGDISPSFFRWSARATDGNIGVLPQRGGLRIYTPDGLVSGGSPAMAVSAPGGYRFSGISASGRDFWAVSTANNQGMIIHRFAMTSSGTYVEDRYPTGITHVYSPSITVGDNFLVIGGQESALSWNLRVYKIGGNGPEEVSLGNYISKYYGKAPSDAYVVPNYINVIDGALHKYNNRYYLYVPAFGLGDVYEIQASDTVDVSVKRAGDQVNIYSQQTPNSGPFYGDRFTFQALSTGAPMSLNWNFGNPEASVNTQTGGTGIDASHQFMNLTSLPTTRQVKAVNASDSSVFGTVDVLQAKPTARVAVKGTQMLFLAPNASSTAPIVSSDEFVDASDGAVEGHYSTWLLDGAPTKSLPNVPVSVGPCGQHQLGFSANYGPYSGSGAGLTTTGTPYAVSIDPIVYTSRPFAAGVSYASSGANIVFSSTTRYSTLTTELPGGGATSVLYQWDLVGAGDAVVLAGPTGEAPLSSIPAWTLAKSAFPQTGVSIRLKLTASANAVAARCTTPVDYTRSEASVGPLYAPDPVIVKSGCGNALAACSFSVASTSQASQANWQYAWSVSGLSATGNASTFSPSIQNSGTYTVTLIATNPIGSRTVTLTFTAEPALCASAPSNSNFVIGMNCSTEPCKPGSTVEFFVQKWGYNPADCDEYRWNFGNGQTLNSKAIADRTPSITYGATGTYNVSLTIIGGASTGTASKTVTIQNDVVIPPPPPPGCSTMSNNNVFIGFSNATATCTQVGGTCGTGDNIVFSAQTFGYSFSCANHAFSWNFGDGSGGSGSQTSKAFTNPGTYNVKLTVSNNQQSFTTSVNVTVGSTAPPPTCPNMSTSNVSATAKGGNGSFCAEGTPCAVNEPVTLSVDGWGYSFACATHTYTWTFPDNTTATGKTIQKTFTANGNYNVQVEVKNPAQTLNLTLPVLIGGLQTGPLPELDFASTVFDAPFVYKFTPTTSIEDSVTKWVWTFSDGGSSTETGATPKAIYHTFPGVGTYTVTLTGSDSTGRTFAPVTKEIKIDAVPGRGGRPVRRW